MKPNPPQTDLAKPKGLSLHAHTEHVLDEARALLDAFPFVRKKYKRLTGQALPDLLLKAACWHDEGKKEATWQRACQADYQEFLKTGRVGRNLLRTYVRHEIESLKRPQVAKLPAEVRVAIAAHHAKLSYGAKARWQEKAKRPDAQGAALWLEMETLDTLKSFEAPLPDILKLNYRFAGPRGLLQWADRRASMREDDNFVPPLQGFAYSFKHPLKRPVQELAETHWADELLLLRAPTGAGKTDACLLWAKKQIEEGRADRLIIAMPTRFTSNALSINVEADLSATGLYHSSAWAKYIDPNNREPQALQKAKAEQEFARWLGNPVTVCTIDHLLISQTHAKEDHHLISFNLAHSCVVIDEGDFYDEFTQANILQLLQNLQELQVPVMFMSASFPDAILPYYQSQGLKCQAIREDSSDLSRLRCQLSEMREAENWTDIQDWLEACLGEPAIIYCNTIDRAIGLYRFIRQNYPQEAVYLYHSRFNEEDKKNKEALLLAQLGREAWQEGRARGIAVLTQIGEMSVNISAKRMISDLCPIDRLVQRVGRLNRFDNESVGELTIVLPQRQGQLYPAPYGSFRRRQGWQAAPALLKTQELLDLRAYSAQDFTDLVNQVYPQVQDLSAYAQNNLKEYQRQIQQNWLIVPAYSESVEDEESSARWRSRDIDAQFRIYVEHPLSYLQRQNPDNPTTFFERYLDFKFYQNACGIDCPTYLVLDGIKAGKIYPFEVEVGEETEKIYVLRDEYYNSEMGLFLGYELEVSDQML